MAAGDIIQSKTAILDDSDSNLTCTFDNDSNAGCAAAVLHHRLRSVCDRGWKSDRVGFCRINFRCYSVGRSCHQDRNGTRSRIGDMDAQHNDIRLGGDGKGKRVRVWVALFNATGTIEGTPILEADLRIDTMPVLDGVSE